MTHPPGSRAGRWRRAASRDPLVLAGPRAAPLVAREVSNRRMHLRLYAIWALGSMKNPEVVPTLVRILDDETEESVFRSEALESLWSLGWQDRSSAAQRYSAREDGSSRARGRSRERAGRRSSRGTIDPERSRRREAGTQGSPGDPGLGMGAAGFEPATPAV